ncbi:MAG: TAXI family TRAP transporter solute-binding subunit [Candidatus Competibacterales bacterium]
MSPFDIRFCRRLLGVFALVALGTNPTAADDSYLLATATTGGTFYPVGVAIATLTKIKLQPTTGVALSAITSAGSAENVKLLGENQTQFALMNGIYGAWAWNGEGPFAATGPQEQLRSISMLWQNVEHFVVRADKVDTGTIADLAQFGGDKFSVGKRNSGAEGSGRHLLDNLGIDRDAALEPVYLGFGPSAEALQNGTIQGASFPAGAPVPALVQVFAAAGENQLAILEFTDPQLQRASGHYGLWTRYVIPADTYPHQSRPVRTIAQPNLLAVRADVPSEVVYQVTRALYENLAFLRNIHPATEAMALERAIGGLPVPLHPGATRYYREQNLAIPQRLLVSEDQ